jgi:hypothetical protein
MHCYLACLNVCLTLSCLKHWLACVGCSPITCVAIELRPIRRAKEQRGLGSIKHTLRGMTCAKEVVTLHCQMLASMPGLLLTLLSPEGCKSWRNFGKGRARVVKTILQEFKKFCSKRALLVGDVEQTCTGSDFNKVLVAVTLACATAAAHT